ncbi:hypothetical protein D3C73_1155190 [compost metagenome]
MIPNGDVKHITHTDPVFIGTQRSIQLAIGLRYYFCWAQLIQQLGRHWVNIDHFVNIKVRIFLLYNVFTACRKVGSWKHSTTTDYAD